MTHRHAEPGLFVRVSGALSNLGIGKVVGCALRQVSVEYFYSIARRRQQAVSAPQMTVIQRLAPQAPRFDCPPQSGWRMVRIVRFFEGEYEVLFRQGQARFPPPGEVLVRRLAPSDDPTETFVFKAHETLYFRDRRFRFVRSLIRQFAACRGVNTWQLRNAPSRGVLGVIKDRHAQQRVGAAFSGTRNANALSGERP